MMYVVCAPTALLEEAVLAGASLGGNMRLVGSRTCAQVRNRHGVGCSARSGVVAHGPLVGSGVRDLDGERVQSHRVTRLHQL